MVKIGFIIEVDSYTGGINYFRNLFYALNSLKEKKIDLFLFIGRKSDKKLEGLFSPYATIVKDSIFDRKSFRWFIHKICYRILGTPHLLNVLMKKYEIQVLSHSSYYGKKTLYMTINWLPDFQFMHLPDMFSDKEIKSIEKRFSKIIHNSDRLVVSSNDAFSDLKKFAPGSEHKTTILKFVSQVDIGNLPKKLEIDQKYNKMGKYFFLPNQFWKHKNHIVVFKALKQLKEQGLEILLLCSGLMQDYRKTNSILELQKFITVNGLEKNIRLLGLIDYRDVLYFIRNSVAVINPSLFEGWSSTVEEAKSFGKKIILSKLPIHLEQNPDNAYYFDPFSVKELASIMSNLWINESCGIDFRAEKQANLNVIKRTKIYGEQYQNLVLELVNQNSSIRFSLM